MEEVGACPPAGGKGLWERALEQVGRDPSIYLVAEDRGGIVGAVLATHDLRKGWLNRSAVLPEEQGRGIARQLVQRAEEELASLGVNITAVQVHEGNRRSRRLFAELGHLEHEDIVYCSKRPGPDG
ncbi:MAG: GNAT family N-acetyltransferase [Euryarchaeota archaeon]|nr:GNAT family N-acetyltransferase [Euryarchaeota archaeon]